MLYGSLFAAGCKMGIPALPFFFAAGVGGIAWVLVLLSPSTVWRDERTGTAEGAARARQEQEPPPADGKSE